MVPCAATVATWTVNRLRGGLEVHREHRNVAAVGDLNPDPTPTENATEDEPDGFAAHHALGNDLLILENLTNLDAFGDRFDLRAYPIALDSDGAPARAVGVSDVE